MHQKRSTDQEIKSLPDIEKLRLVISILADLTKPDPEIYRIWAMKPKALGAYKTVVSTFPRRGMPSTETKRILSLIGAARGCDV